MDNNINKTPVFSERMANALAVLDDLRREGYAVLPIIPSLAMAEAGARAGDLSPHTVARIYAAMIKASMNEENLSIT